MRKSVALPALAVMALAGPAMAGNLNYNYIELGITGESIDDPYGDEELDGSGLGITGSWEFAPGVYGFAGLSGTEYEYKYYPDDDFSIGRLHVGVGFNLPLGRTVDLVSGVSLQRLRLEDDFSNTLNEQGYGLNVGLRGMVGSRFEWHAGIDYVDFGDGIDDTSWKTGFRYSFTRMFAMGLDIGSTDKDQGSAMLAFRFNLNGN